MNKVIFLVQNGTDFSKLENEMKKSPDHTIYSIDYESHKFLEKKKIVHVIGEDILSSADFDKIDLSAINSTKNCFDSYRKILTFEDIFLAELFDHELFFYVIRQFLNAYVISKILQNEDAQTIIDFTNVGDYIKKLTNSKKIAHIHFGITKDPGLYHDNIRISFNLSKRFLNLSLSSARSIEVYWVPIIGSLFLYKNLANLIGVWPPN